MGAGIGGYFIYLKIFKDKEVKELEKIDLKLKLLDKETQKELNGNITLYEARINETNENKTILGYNEVLKRDLGTTWETITVVQNKTYMVLAKSEDYYSELYQFESIPSGELIPKKIELIKIGNLSISHNSNLQNGENTINLTIVSNGIIKNIGICLKWSVGVTYITANLTEIQILQRLPSYTNICYLINQTLLNQSITIPLEVKGSYVTSSDYVNVTIFDEDWILKDSNFNYYYELGKIDLGKEDVKYLLK